LASTLFRFFLPTSALFRRCIASNGVAELRLFIDRKRDGASGREVGLDARAFVNVGGEVEPDDPAVGFLARFFEPNREERIDIATDESPRSATVISRAI
jgi:hypothetical protein